MARTVAPLAGKREEGLPVVSGLGEGSCGGSAPWERRRGRRGCSGQAAAVACRGHCESSGELPGICGCAAYKKVRRRLRGAYAQGGVN